MILAYEKLGMLDLASDTRRILAENYSDSAPLIDYDDATSPSIWEQLKTLNPIRKKTT